MSGLDSRAGAPPLVSLDALLDTLEGCLEGPRAATAFAPAAARIVRMRGWAAFYDFACAHRMAIRPAGVLALRQARPPRAPAPGWELDARIAGDVMGWPVALEDDPHGLRVVAAAPEGPMLLNRVSETRGALPFHPSRCEEDAELALQAAERRYGWDRLDEQVLPRGRNARIRRGAQTFVGAPAETRAGALATALAALSTLAETTEPAT